MVSSPDALIKFGVSETDGKLVGDDSDAHVMTIAPTGAGKGRTSIIPNLLTWPGSVFVIDPKGENVARTLRQRQKLNENVFVLDPFLIAKSNSVEIKRTGFNPLDFIDTGDSGITQADRLADTLIVKEGKENLHFTNEARALLKAIILHVRTDPLYERIRDLGTVNEIASRPMALVGAGDTPGEMQENPAYNGLVARLADRIAAKSDREGPAVWSTLQANLGQFLDDPRVADNLSRSDFDFADLKSGKTTIFAVLPAQYLETFDRWLRLLVGSALDRLLEGMGEENRPEIPVLMILDEFAHLGNLEAVKTAYGLARGAGVKIWAILQSLSQLDDIYGMHGRENLIANSGAIEIFNLTDNAGCKYFSERIGESYIEVRSISHSVTTETKGASTKGSTGEKVTSSNESESLSQDKRARMLPQQIAALDPNKKILFRRGYDFEILRMVRYDEHPVLKTLAG